MIVYVARADCPDYYCGCGGESAHLVGVFGDEVSAQVALEEIAADEGAEYAPGAITAVEVDAVSRWLWLDKYWRLDGDH